MGLADREKNRENIMRQEVVKSMISTSNESIDVTSSKDKMVVVPEKEESRSKRLNLLIKPSVHQKALEKCKTVGDSGISLNECLNQLLESWIEE